MGYIDTIKSWLGMGTSKATDAVGNVGDAVGGVTEKTTDVVGDVASGAAGVAGPAARANLLWLERVLVGA